MAIVSIFASNCTSRLPIDLSLISEDAAVPGDILASCYYLGTKCRTVIEEKMGQVTRQ